MSPGSLEDLCSKQKWSTGGEAITLFCTAHDRWWAVKNFARFERQLACPAHSISYVSIAVSCNSSYSTDPIPSAQGYDSNFL
jgi:hypothetical protein